MAATRNPSCCCCCFHFHEISLEIPFRWSPRDSLTHPSHSHHPKTAAFFALSRSLARTPTSLADWWCFALSFSLMTVQSLVSNRTFSRQKKIETHTENLHTLHFFEKFSFLSETLETVTARGGRCVCNPKVTILIPVELSKSAALLFFGNSSSDTASDTRTQQSSRRLETPARTQAKQHNEEDGG